MCFEPSRWVLLGGPLFLFFLSLMFLMFFEKNVFHVFFFFFSCFFVLFRKVFVFVFSCFAMISFFTCVSSVYPIVYPSVCWKAVGCDLQGRNIHFTNSKTFDWSVSRPTVTRVTRPAPLLTKKIEKKRKNKKKKTRKMKINASEKKKTWQNMKKKRKQKLC